MIHFKDESVTVWSYGDRLFVRALLYLIKPVFQHIVSPLCLHLKGPAGVKIAINSLKKALTNGDFHYFIRADISGYYASIDRGLLWQQVETHFDDPRVLNYLHQMINIPIIKNAEVLNERFGIPRRSSLSPFFGALYLNKLDRAFENRSGISYHRYMDDVVVLTRSKNQYLKAKRQMQQILNSLKLRCARSKTKMGLLNRGFHFLGIDFKLINVPVISEPSVMIESGSLNEVVPQSQPRQSHLQILLHERSCQRAQAKMNAMREDSEPPGKAQHYLANWAKWWSRTAQPIARTDCITRWILRALRRTPDIVWLGTGLLFPLGLRPRATLGCLVPLHS